MPPNIAALREAIALHHYLFTEHASDRAVLRNISSQEVEEAILDGEVIEDYPDDKYGPSCLILGYTKRGRPLHIQVTYPPEVKVITVYSPSTEEWNQGFRVRK